MAEHRLSGWRLAAFASPAAGLSAAGLPITLYVPAYYASDLGIGLAVVGTVVALTKLWDMITDPLVGWFTDNVSIKWGRRRFGVLIGVPFMLLFGALTYLPERLAPGEIGPVYMLISLIGLYTGFTLMSVSLTAWGAELHTDYHERSRIQGAIQFAHLVGNFSLLSVPMAIEFMGDATTLSTRIEAMGVFMMIVVPLTVALAATNVREPVPRTQPRIGIKRAMKALGENANLMRLLIVDFLLALPSAARATVYVFLIAHVIRRPEWTSLLLVGYFAGSVVSVPVWVRISRRIGKHKAVVYGLICHVIFSLGYLIPGEGDVLLFGLMQLGSAFVFGGQSFLVRSMIADVADADVIETGQQRTGLFYSLVTMTNKIGLALGVAVFYPLLEFIGFNPQGENTEFALNGMVYMFVGVPFIAETTAAWILSRYSIDETVQKNLRKAISGAVGRPRAADEIAG